MKIPQFANQMVQALLAVGLVAGPVLADPIQVDFEADASGNVANGYTPTGGTGLTLADTVGNALLIGDFGDQSDGQGLAVGSDQDGSALLLAFTNPIDFLSLQFGNDDPTSTNAGDLGILTLFLNSGTQIDQIMVELNRDDILNQTIAFGAIGGSVLFDYAEFAFTSAFGSRFTGGGTVNVGTIEIVDNIVYNFSAPGDIVAVPEPGVLGLFLIGLLLAGSSGLRRRVCRAIRR